jgi:transcription elongation factor Elf1
MKPYECPICEGEGVIVRWIEKEGVNALASCLDCYGTGLDIDKVSILIDVLIDNAKKSLDTGEQL